MWYFQLCSSEVLGQTCNISFSPIVAIGDRHFKGLPWHGCQAVCLSCSGIFGDKDLDAVRDRWPGSSGRKLSNRAAYISKHKPEGEEINHLLYLT